MRTEVLFALCSVTHAPLHMGCQHAHTQELSELHAGADDGKAPPPDEVFGDLSASLGYSEPLRVTSEMHRIWEGLGET